jgi:hypothetical protein
MIEPNWLLYGRNDEGLWLELGDSAPPGQPRVLFEGSSELVLARRNEEGRWLVSSDVQTGRFMLRFDERWTPRWWDLP